MHRTPHVMLSDCNALDFERGDDRGGGSAGRGGWEGEGSNITSVGIMQSGGYLILPCGAAAAVHLPAVFIRPPTFQSIFGNLCSNERDIYVSAKTEIWQ